MVSSLTFRFLFHFEFNFVYGIRKCSNFILLQELSSFLSIISWRDCIKFIDKFLVASLEIYIYITCHLFYFSLSNLGFSSFYCLTAVARTSNTMLDKSGNSGHPCLGLDLRGNAFSFSPLNTILAMAYQMAFTILRFVPSTATLLRVLTINGCLNFSKTFSAYLDGHDFYSSIC